MLKLSEGDWREREAAHRALLLPYTEGFRTRRSRGESHPVYDFLFCYYTFSSAKLEEWHPGIGFGIEATEQSRALMRYRQYRERSGALFVTPELATERDLRHFRWIHQLSSTILARAPRFSCFGLHEWAMVYRSDAIRHAYPLRLSGDEIASVVESAALCCSHFDAFRFFTPRAAPLNVIQPTAETRLAHEQGGCLHANMDLYKWAFKLTPWISSDLLRECFFLALRTRELDMRASPYDLRPLGFEPVPIETSAGRAEYVALQREIAEEAHRLRQTLVCVLEQLNPELTERKAIAHDDQQLSV